jgi:hypothetical protein
MRISTFPNIILLANLRREFFCPIANKINKKFNKKEKVVL